MKTECLIKLNGYYYPVRQDSKLLTRGCGVVEFWDYSESTKYCIHVKSRHNRWSVDNNGRLSDNKEYEGDIVEVIGAVPENTVDIRLTGSVEKKDSASFYLNKGDGVFSIIDWNMIDAESRELVESLLKAQEEK